MKTVRLASMANSANNPNIARQAYETSQFAVNRANNVATGRLPNTYTPYDSNGNPYSYFNSSRQTGKTPSPDAPRVEDVSGDAAYYCDREDALSASALITGATTFIRGAISELLEDGAIEIALNAICDLVQKNAPLSIKGALPVVGNIVNDLDPNLIAKVSRAANWLADKAPIVGGIVDISSQLANGEGLGHALIKSTAHVGIGLGVTSLITLTGVVASPISVALLGAGAAYFISLEVDKVYDNYLREPLDNIWDKFTNTIGKIGW